MHRITLWISGTLVLVALAIGFQLNIAGVGGKEGEDERQPGIENTSDDPTVPDPGQTAESPAPTPTRVEPPGKEDGAVNDGQPSDEDK